MLSSNTERRGFQRDEALGIPFGLTPKNMNALTIHDHHFGGVVTRRSASGWVPDLVAAAGPRATDAYIEFFTAPGQPRCKADREYHDHAMTTAARPRWTGHFGGVSKLASCRASAGRGKVEDQAKRKRS